MNSSPTRALILSLSLRNRDDTNESPPAMARLTAAKLRMQTRIVMGDDHEGGGGDSDGESHGSPCTEHAPEHRQGIGTGRRLRRATFAAIEKIESQVGDRRRDLRSGALEHDRL